MNDARIMGGDQARHDATRNVERSRDRQLRFLLQERRQIRAVDVRHRDVLDAVDFTKVVNPDDVLVRHLAREQQLALEAKLDIPRRDWIGGDLRADDFHRHRDAQFRVPGLIDGAHAAHTQHFDDVIAGAKRLPNRERPFAPSAYRSPRRASRAPRGARRAPRGAGPAARRTSWRWLKPRLVAVRRRKNSSPGVPQNSSPGVIVWESHVGGGDAGQTGDVSSRRRIHSRDGVASGGGGTAGFEGTAGFARPAGIHSAVCALPANSPMSVSSPGTLGSLGAGTGVNTPVAASPVLMVDWRVTSAPGGGFTPVTASSSDEGGTAGFDGPAGVARPAGIHSAVCALPANAPMSVSSPGRLGTLVSLGTGTGVRTPVATSRRPSGRRRPQDRHLVSVDALEVPQPAQTIAKGLDDRHSPCPR